MRFKSIIVLNKQVQSRFGRVSSRKQMNKLFDADYSNADELIDKLSLPIAGQSQALSADEIDLAIFDKQQAYIDFIKKNCFDSLITDFLIDDLSFRELKNLLRCEKIESILGFLEGKNEEIVRLSKESKMASCALAMIEKNKNNLSKNKIEAIINKAYFSERLLAAQRSGFKRLLDCILAEIDLKNIISIYRWSNFDIGKESLLQEFIPAGTLSCEYLCNSFKKYQNNELEVEKLIKSFPSRYRKFVRTLVFDCDSIRTTLEYERVLYIIMSKKRLLTALTLDSFACIAFSRLCEYRLTPKILRYLGFIKDDKIFEKLSDDLTNNGSKIALISCNQRALVLNAMGLDVYFKTSDCDVLATVKSLEEKKYSVIFVDEASIKTRELEAFNKASDSLNIVPIKI